MKPRSDYEQSAWRRLVRFVDGESLADAERRAEEMRENDAQSQQAADTEAELSFEQQEKEDREDRKRRLETEHEKEAMALLEKYRNWPKEHGVKIFGRLYAIMAVLLCLIIIVTLLVTVSYLPEFGQPDNPNNNEVVRKYNEMGLEETGATNIVAGMILDYRAFDTLGESHVLFVAAVCVMILLRLELTKDGKPTDKKRAAEENDRLYEPKNDKILQLSAKILVPIIIMYGIYVILNGHLSPGGGFSGGAIIGAGLILYVNAFGFKEATKILNRKNYAVISVVPLLFYALAKGYSFFTGANHLESGIPKGTPGHILSSGLILPLNICVGLVVACTMYHFYTLFRKGGM
ncbi:MAG: MnhB domain-containing protein [Lachnospiraceae bacterium]|nr:MnhB domain-containing protein [Lachnospiraceae bacterium]